MRDKNRDKVDIVLMDAECELLEKELIFSVDTKSGNGFLYFRIEALRNI